MLYISEEQKQELLETVDMFSVANSLGIEVKKIGSNYSIICPEPGHNDNNYGNCMLYPHNYYCWSCGKRGDAISLVKNTLNCSTYESVCYLVNTFGNPDECEQKGNLKTITDSINPICNIALNKIGLGENINSNKYYYPIGLVDYKDGFSCRKDLAGDYIKCSFTKKRNLKELRKEDPKTYEWLIYHKAMESLHKIDRIRYLLLHPMDNALVRQIYVLFANAGISVSEIDDFFVHMRIEIIDALYELVK